MVTTREVTVVNTGATVLRISGCVDDALDLWPGQRAQVDAPRFSRTGCAVYVDQDYRGCLVLRAPDASPVNILARLNRQQSEGSCDQLN